jgi:hypothetical protein
MALRYSNSIKKNKPVTTKVSDRFYVIVPQLVQSIVFLRQGRDVIKSLEISHYADLLGLDHKPHGIASNSSTDVMWFEPIEHEEGIDWSLSVRQRWTITWFTDSQSCFLPVVILPRLFYSCRINLI